MSSQASLKDYLGASRGSSLKLAEVAEQGLPTQSLSLLRDKGLTFTEMASVIPPRTLKHRNARGENLSSEETERAVRVASIIGHAEKVFGNPEKAMRWLRYPNDRLDARTPLSLLRTEAGARLIDSMLWGIADGIFS